MLLSTANYLFGDFTNCQRLWYTATVENRFLKIGEKQIMFNSISMTQMAATIANAMGAEAPKQADRSIPMVDAFVEHTLGSKKAERVLIYNPDCVGMWLYQKYTELFIPVTNATQLAVPVATVNPSWTPVCFGTMYTGVLPEVHGIQGYAKPVITVDSLFDSLPRSGKKVALVAVTNSSMSMIFQNRNIDYYLTPYDDSATEKGLELIAEDKYDLVVVYNQEYDDMIHETTPESPRAMDALKHHIRDFDRLTSAVREHWSGYDTLVCWATDHGNHVDWRGHGTHGEYRPGDINVMHFYGIYPKK